MLPSIIIPPCFRFQICMQWMKCFSSCINWIALEGFQAMRKNQLPLGIIAPSWNYSSNGRALHCQCRGQDSNSSSLLNFSRHSRNCLTNAKNCDVRTNSFWQRKMDSRYVEISVRKCHFAPELLVFSKLPTTNWSESFINNTRWI